MVFRDLTVVGVRHLMKFHVGTTVEHIFQVFVEFALILFHGQHIICTLIHDGFGKVGLTAQRIDRHHAAFQRQDAQPFRYRGDFIRFGQPLSACINLALSEHHVLGGGPSTNHMNRVFAQTFVMRTTECFAIHGDNFAFQSLTDRLNPSGKGLFKFKGIESGKDAPKEPVLSGAEGYHGTECH